MEREGGPELAVVNPVGILGPVLGPDLSTSILLVQRLMDGAMPGVPRLSFGLVDVRDVADLHLRAMTDPAARGERFLAMAGEFMSFPRSPRSCARAMGDVGKGADARAAQLAGPAGGLFDAAVKQITPELGKPKEASNEKAKATARLVAALERGRNRRDRGEPDRVTAREECSRIVVLVHPLQEAR